jgi:hypothetical protein
MKLSHWRREATMELNIQAVGVCLLRKDPVITCKFSKVKKRPSADI